MNNEGINAYKDIECNKTNSERILSLERSRRRKKEEKIKSKKEMIGLLTNLQIIIMLFIKINTTFYKAYTLTP
jgi:hypothetical protein